MKTDLTARIQGAGEMETGDDMTFQDIFKSSFLENVQNFSILDIALAMDADGVHVGQSDMEAGDVRDRLGPDKIIGVSARTVEQALLAQAHGADYLGVGAVFSTSTKSDAKNVSHETLKEICKAVRIPVVAIGGITRDNVKELTGCGADGIAVISAVFAQQDIESAARELKKCSEEMVKG